MGTINRSYMGRTTKIFYIKPNNSSFINTDQKILEKHYKLETFLLNQGKGKLKFLFRLIGLLFYLLKNIRGNKLLVCWFADYHAFVMVLVGKLFRKKTVIFIGGMEAVCYKELGKGVYINKFRGDCVRYALRNATLVLPNHKSLIYHENYYYNPENPHIDGIKQYVPNLRCKIEIVPNGIDTSRIKRIPDIAKDPKMILTIGTMSKLAHFYNKGFDLFIEVAHRNPDLDFVLVNINLRYLSWVETNYKVSEIRNLTVVSGFCPEENLVNFFNKARVFVQASITEGMPLSLGEAMLCECIPVGSNVNGIPDAIGVNGVIVYNRNVFDLENAIRQALTMDTGHKAREYTIQNFSMEVREKKIIEVFSKYLQA